jgi:hypothetical protein
MKPPGFTKKETLSLANSAAATARLPLPIPFSPSRGSAEGYVRIREQARIQLEARTEGKPKFECLPNEPGEGLSRLPLPSAGDIFLDLEGDPFVADGGLEYLFGVATAYDDGNLVYEGRWALDRGQERAAFEWFIDFTFERLQNGLGFIREIDDREPLRPKPFDVSSLVFQAPLLEHAQMWIVPRGLCYLAFGEAEVHGREMPARQMVREVGCGESNRSLENSHPVSPDRWRSSILNLENTHSAVGERGDHQFPSAKPAGRLWVADVHNAKW